MEIIFFLLFCVAAYFSFYLPGKLVLSRSFHFSSFDTSLLSWPVGLGFFLFGIYLSAWIHLSYLYLAVIIAISVYAVFRDRSLLKIHFKIVDPVSWGIILIGSLAFLSLTAFSYLQTKNRLQFIGTINVIDGFLHVAYTKGLLTTFPPNHAGLASVPLRGYHYFYDLMMSRLVLFYHFKPEDLYYRYLSFFISVLYGGGFYLLSRKLTDNKISQRLVLFFAYFAQSFAFLLSFFTKSISPIGELGSIYPLELILNPAIILSIGMFLCFAYLLLETKPKIAHMVIVGFLFGIIIELKVYTGIIGVSVFATVILFRILKMRDPILPYFFGILTMMAVILITYVPNNLGAGALWFSPFFAYSAFMQEFIFASWHWEAKRIIFRDHHNILHLIFLYVQAVGTFWLLSLGSRVAAFLGLSHILKKAFWMNEANIVVMVMIMSPILIGSLFVQSISIFDTKQFFWIASALIGIPSGIALGNFLRNKNIGLQVTMMVFVIFLSLGGIYAQLNLFVVHPEVLVIPNKDSSFLKVVGHSIPDNAFILYINELNPQVPITQLPFVRAPVVAAITGKSTYFELESAQFDLEKIYNQRQTNITLLRKLIVICNPMQVKHILKQIGTSYVVITSENRCLDGMSTKKITSDTGLSFYTIAL